MAMRFAQAQRAQNPDLAAALTQQEMIANRLKAAEMQRDAQNKSSNLNAAGMFAEAAPEGTFTNAWDTLNAPDAAVNPNFVTPTSIDAGTGALASSAPQAAAINPITGASSAAPMMSPVAADAGWAGLMSGAGEGAAAAEGAAALGGVAETAALAEGATALGTAAETAAAVEAAAAGTAATSAAAGGGASAALAGMGPAGWAALGLGALGLFG